MPSARLGRAAVRARPPPPGARRDVLRHHAVVAAWAAAAGTYVNPRGATVAHQCPDAGLLCIAPMMLGDGVRLFKQPGGANVRLERIHLSGAALATNVRFRVAR